MLTPADLLAKIALDAYLLARCGMHNNAIPDGRVWERATADLLWRPGLVRRQAAGLTGFFGRVAQSGCRHELDACASGWIGSLMIECKAKRGGVDKADIATFHLKTFDYYCGNLEEAHADRWWRFLVAARPVETGFRRLCMQQGIILCDPLMLPLPVLVRFATRPSADLYIPEAKLREVIRLGETACLPMQERWRLLPSGEICFRPDLLASRDVDDLIWLQEELNSDLLDLYERHRPGRLEARAGFLVSRLLAAYGEGSRRGVIGYSRSDVRSLA